MADKDKKEPRWEITQCSDGMHMNRPELAENRQNELMEDGWEPFAITDGRIWFRRRARQQDERAE